ncbi:MAG TPA: hypothetical protein V6C52_02345 [Coleofasciculaceae cyanobacterium]|jgi:hypothetical protein
MSNAQPVKRTSQRGYGLVLMMLFVGTTVMVMLSLQMTTQTSLGQFMTATRNRVTAESMAETGLSQARAQILTDLDAGTLDPLLDSGAGSPATWTYTSPVSVPSDPSNLGSAPVSVGSFTATITQWRVGGWYVVKSVGTAGGSSVTVSDLMEIQPSYTCSVQGAATENAILAGNITTLSDDDLIKYAQNNCMLKPPPAGIAAYSVTAGTGASCSSGIVTDTGSGTLNQGNTTGTCERRIQGTYSLVYLGSASSSLDIDIHNTSGGLTEVHATDLSGANHGIDAWNRTTSSSSTSPVFYKLNSITNGAFARTSTVDDTISIFGNVYDGNITTLAGNDTVIIGGSLDGTTWTYNIYLGTGNDAFYAKSSGHESTWGGDGNDQFYVGNALVGNIYAEAGDDIISCTDILGSGGCSRVGDWEDVLGGAGNDILSLDGPFGNTASSLGTTPIGGEAGYNIVYVKSISNTTYACSMSATTTGSSLAIVGGNMAGGAPGCTLSATGSNNVLLIKSGSTSTGMTISGFARTIYY